MDIECLTPAYNKIITSGIYKKIKEKEEVLKHIFLYKSSYFDGVDEIFAGIRKYYFDNKRGISEKSKFFEDILLLENEFAEEDYFPATDFEKNLIKHPFYLSYIVLGEEIFDYKKFNFPNLRSLGSAITSFCIGERIFGDEYTWRTGNLKNNISKNIHGDLFAGQRNVFGKFSLENTLFGKEENFDVYSEVKYSGVSAYQDWSEFLVATLKYAEYLGKEKIREIVEWEEVLEESGGGVGTAATEAFGTDFSKSDLEFLMSFPVIQDGKKLEQYPLHLYSQTHNSYYPYFSEGKLFYLSENESGKISFEVYKNKAFSKVLEYSEGDLSPILTATYKFFARDRSKMYKIMDWFNEKYK